MIFRLTKSMLFLLISCLFTGPVHAQSPTLSFRTIFESPKNETFNLILEDSQGDFVAVGTRDSSTISATYQALILAKLDSNGNILYRRELKTTYEIIKHRISEIDGGYILWHTDLWNTSEMIRLNFKGDVQWNIPFDNDAVCFTTDGIVGAKYTDIIVQDSVIEYVTLQKADLSGTLLWRDTIFRSSYPNNPGTNSGPAIVDVSDLIETHDGNFVVIGLASLWGAVVVDGRGYPYLIKADANRNSLWVKFFNSYWRHYPDKLIEATNGDFLAVGTKEIFRPIGPYLERLGILRFSSSGGLLFSTESQSIFPGKDIVEFEPNKILVVSGDSQIFQFSSSLTIQDSIRYNRDNIWSFTKTTDNELAMTGHSLTNNGTLNAVVSKSGDTIMSGIYSNPVFINKASITVQPNPNSGHFSLASDIFFTKPVSIEMYNIMGEIVHKVTYNNFSNIDIDLNHKPSGMYLLKAMTEEETLSVNRIFIQ